MTLNCISSARGCQCTVVLCGDCDKEYVIFMKDFFVFVYVMLFYLSFITSKEKNSSVTVYVRDIKGVLKHYKHL